MSRGMGPTKAELLVILLISIILALESAAVSSAVEDLMVVQCKHNCKHGLQNQKECEDRCNEKMMMEMEMEMEKETHGRQDEEEEDPFCQWFCKPFLEDEDGEGMYQHCMTVCPRTKSIPKMMGIEQRRQEVGGDGVANGVLLAKCDRRCSPYTEPEDHKRCMGDCFRSIISKTVDNEAVCDTKCTILQEKPLSIECVRVCHERIPGAFATST